MIVFGSQRSGGGDLATHLENTHDNEYVEVSDLRGSIADDLHGAFSEWEVHAHTMTKSQKYLYSLSINPDPAQGPLTREQYADYIARAEESLGLQAQGRAIVFHIKEGKDGHLREHCHVVWSRTDIQDMKAVAIAFDKRKLMMVTREFAQDHNLKLPQGYENGNAKAPQLSMYEKAQQDQTGLTREDRITAITELWKHSDNAKAFVAALEDHGYMLATGRRPYVLVDIYGNTNALPKMIDDKSVRTKDIRAFLQKDYAPETLPSVEEAQAIAKLYYQEQKKDENTKKNSEQLEILGRSQEQRRQKLKNEIAERSLRQEQQKNAAKIIQQKNISNLKTHHAQEDFRINFERAQHVPKGLAAFLSKVSGIEFVRQKLHQREDRKREARQAEQKIQLETRHQQERLDQQRRHELQMMELRRREHAQIQVFKRETKSFKTSHAKEQATGYRKGHDHMPALNLILGPHGRRAAPQKAMKRYYAPTLKELNIKAKRPAPPKPIELRHDFTVSAEPSRRKKSKSLKEPNVDFSVGRKERDDGKKH